MHDLLSEFRRRTARWTLEHQQVAVTASQLNLQRVRSVTAIVAVINTVFVLWLVATLWRQHGESDVTQWKLGLLVTHLMMGLSFGALAWLTRLVQFVPNSWMGRALPLLVMALGLCFVTAFAVIGQWVTPSITPFVIGVLACSLALYLRPLSAAWLFAGAYLLFAYAIRITQVDPQILLYNRLNGLAAVGMAWVLSFVLWRNFTTISLQQEQLEKANTELQNKQRELLRLTRLDGLTGLYNRSTFVELSRQELARAQRQSSNTTILLLDLDFFKRVNDTWGHPAGDAVLKNVAFVANNTVRATDLVGRLGGEEFLILLPNTSLEAARVLAEKLRANMERHPTPWESTVIKATISIGLASTSAAENRDFDTLYTAADKALYQAKERGRNQVV
ncbi:MAG: GGDEF domain-containing protein [Rhodoferax sp.]|jgi:diguanylate cyclase (GGDEF)-like protein|nr:GGDEF domain-containing protein [Rhodoferax sp.]